MQSEQEHTKVQRAADNGTCERTEREMRWGYRRVIMSLAILTQRWAETNELRLRIIQGAADKGIAQQPEGRRAKSKNALNVRRAPCEAGTESTSH
jgi:uncharacterized protein YqfA (UPF0365 family)